MHAMMTVVCTIAMSITLWFSGNIKFKQQSESILLNSSYSVNVHTRITHAIDLARGSCYRDLATNENCFCFCYV